MCEFDRIVSKQDDVIWRYEEFVADPKHIDKTGFGSNDMSWTLTHKSRDSNASFYRKSFQNRLSTKNIDGGKKINVSYCDMDDLSQKDINELEQDSVWSSLNFSMKVAKRESQGIANLR